MSVYTPNPRLSASFKSAGIISGYVWFSGRASHNTIFSISLCISPNDAIYA